MEQAGLLEGIEHGKERKLQSGFDRGFQSASRLLFDAHMLLGALRFVQRHPRHLLSSESCIACRRYGWS